MGNALALATIIMQLLPILQTGTVQLIAFVQAVRTAAQQSNEWTDEQEMLFRANCMAKPDDAHTPDADLPGTIPGIPSGV